MRRWIWISAAVLAAGAALWAWPLAGAAELARTARGGDAAAVFARVDVDALRRSLARQIAEAYLEVSGRGRRMGAIGRSLTGAAITTVADPYVAGLLTPENVQSLLARGRINPVVLDGRPLAVSGALPNFADLLDEHVLSAVTGSYFDRPKDFVIPVEGRSAADRFGVHMHLVGLTWKLGGVDLPAATVQEMARSILERQPPAAL